MTGNHAESVPNERPTSATQRVVDVSRPPAGVLVAFRGGVAILLACYFFMVFCVARGLIGGIGFRAGVLAQCFIATAAMTGFVVWLAPFLELPEIWFRHRLPATRRAHGLCPECGYAVGRAARTCPECGSDGSLRPSWQFGWRTLRVFMLIATVAYLVGCVLALVWIAADERVFAQERASVAASTYFQRERAWPMHFVHFEVRPDGTVLAPGVVTEGEIDPQWQPRSERTPLQR